MNMPFHKEQLRLYYIAGSQDFDGDTPRFLAVLETALQTGIGCFQFRDKGEGSLSTKSAKITLAQSAKSLCHQYHIPFIINDDIHLAKQLVSDGIHLGQSDIKTLGSNALLDLRKHFSIIGLSINSVQEAQDFYPLYQAGLVDYFGVGPIFATGSKSDHSLPVGMSFPKVLREHGISTPLVAIGGIKTCHVRELISQAVDGVAVISAISRADDVARAVKDILGEFT